MRAPYACAVVLAAVFGLLAGCAELEETLVVAADVVQRNPELIRNEEERAKWQAGARVVTSWTQELDTPHELGIGQSLAARAFAGFGPPHPDQELQDYVSKVGKVVALQSDRPELPYTFAVVTSDTPNALAMPGGFVFVSTSLLKRLGSESELACVLGHEVCHVAQKHGVEILERDRKVFSVVDFGALLDDDVAEHRAFVDEMWTKLTVEGYDRRYETIADTAGTEYAWRAGYHPAGLVPFLEAARDARGPVAFEFHATHPNPGQRLTALRQKLTGLGDYAEMPRLEQRYRRNVLDRLE